MKVVRTTGFRKNRNGNWDAYHDWRPARSHGTSPFGKVLIDIGEWQLTLREAIFSVFIAGVMTFAGFFISGCVEKSVHDSKLKYSQAAEILTDAEFEHAMRTDIGDAFASGKFETLDPVTYDNLPGKHLMIRAAYQHYTMHTRVVHYTTGSGKNLRHRTRLEHYWTWDTRKVDCRSATAVEFCGSRFSKDKFDYSYVRSGSTVRKTGPNDRIVFSFWPTSFDASVFSDFRDGTVSDGTTLRPGTTSEQLRNEYLVDHSLALFWAFWIFATCVAVGMFVWLDNDWMED